MLASERKRCNAKTRDGGKCQTWAMPNGRCRMHGGSTPTGLGLPQTKSGRYSRDLPTRLAARYEQSRTDAELLDLREEVSLTDARLADLLAKVDTGESGAKWKALRKTHNELMEAILGGDSTKLMAVVRVMGRMVDEGTHDADLWDEIFTAVEQRRRLVESERKRLEQMEQLVTVSEMMVLASALLSSIQAHVSDRRALAAISSDFARLVTIDGQTAQRR